MRSGHYSNRFDLKKSGEDQSHSKERDKERRKREREEVKASTCGESEKEKNFPSTTQTGFQQRGKEPKRALVNPMFVSFLVHINLHSLNLIEWF